MKKRITLIISTLLLAVVAFAAGGAAITFKEKEHDFGSIKASAGSVAYKYEFTNTGTAPLVIVTVTNGGCGCTTPDYPKQPIAPGKTGAVTIHYNPKGFKGEFHREVSVKTNAGKRVKLKFKGVVIP